MAPVLQAIALAASIAVSSATTIAEINGIKFLSPFQGQNVTNVTGVVSAKGPDGLWLRSNERSDRDERSSQSIYVFNRNFASNMTVGDSIVINGRVTEYRSNKDYLFLTQIDRPALVRKVSSGSRVEPLVIGKDTRDPPNKEYSSLDGGDVFAVPNNKSLVSVANPTLEPRRYGLDFWESLIGELVTIRKPVALTKPNNFGDTWVAGNWRLTGKNDRDGVTMTDKDANPEAIIIGTPLDGTKNPTTTKMGDDVEDITGIVSYAFGFYRILPSTAMKVTKSQKPALPKITKLDSEDKCDGITMGAYNVENLAPNSSHHPALAEHIVKYMKSPDIMFLQEVQDDNGPTNDAVVSANKTLETLTAAIRTAGGPSYAFADIAPVDDQDGGQPGGNIRTAYLYKPDLLRLYKQNPGGSLDANAVLDGPTLKFNPGRIDPTNSAWRASRKPLVAQWEVIGKKSWWDKRVDTFFTVNVHFGSKGGSSSLHGDARPPVNGGVADRTAQALLTANFVKDILAKDKNAKVITAGDFNEFTFVDPLEQYVKISGLKDADAAARIDELERYTYLFDMNAQQLDHMFVSPSLARDVKYEHIHVNTWPEFSAQVSDHDPSVARLDVCA